MFKIGFFGFGVMGQALGKSLLKVMPADYMFACDQAPDGVESFGATRCYSLHDLIQRVNVLVLAVKPQTFLTMDFAGVKIPESTIVVSIMAGVSIEQIQQRINVSKVVRAMPNIAAKVEHAVIGWCGSEEVSMPEKEFMQALFSACGWAFELPREDLMHAVTAVSGSGPAYFFALAESMAKSAEAAGFDAETAQLLAKHTLAGAGKLAEVSTVKLSELRESVTSKGGTTEAALGLLVEKDFDGIVQSAVKKAWERSVELSQNS